MAAKSRSKKKPPTRAARLTAVGLLFLTLLGGVAAAAKNADTLVTLWQTYFGGSNLGPLENARNVPRELFSSGASVSVELVQVASDGEPRERIYDLYMQNNESRDLLLTEIRYGPGAVYMSTGSQGLASGAAQPTAAYTVTAQSNRGAAALSPPYVLRAKTTGAVRLRLRSEKPGQPLAFEIFAADGKKVASVNRMLGE